MDFNQLIDEFIKENPDHTKEDLMEICKLYFTYIREEIESGNLNQIRIKYFGSFRPMLGKLKHLKYNINWEKFNEKEKNRYIKLLGRYDEIIKSSDPESKEDL